MNILLDLLFPPRCAFCGALTDRPGVCPDCQLPRIPPDQVLRPVGERGYLCAVALYYDGPVQTGVRALKFEGKSWRTEVFAQYIVQAAAEHLSGAFDAVTYVPVSPRRKFVRGYDQAQLLARAAAKVWEVRAEQTLRKIRHNQAQSSLTRPEDRRENVKNAYAVPRPERVAGRRFLLIDDVCTTGGTLSACADALMDAGAGSVVCAALAGGHGADPGK